MPSPARLNWPQFHDRLKAGEAERKRREPLLAALEHAPAFIVYTFGIRGRDLALQLRGRGIRCLIFDNSEGSREKALAEGFELAPSLDDESLPVLIGAGQKQIEIMASLERPAYFLAEALYALELRNQYAPARAFTEATLQRAADLFSVYQRLDPQSADVFVQVLEYRASLRPDKVSAWQPMADMWRPPVEGLRIASFCDIGAYDGDSLRATKAVFPELRRSFTLEPNPSFEAEIAATARSLGVDNSHYAGGVWDSETRLGARETANGMLIVEEDAQGPVTARPLDALLGGEAFDFVKMDVEGAEARVIQGGQRSLHEAHCVAVAAYHLPEDLIALPARMDAIRPDWKLAFAHYSQSFDDSIFYFCR